MLNQENKLQRISNIVQIYPHIDPNALQNLRQVNSSFRNSVDNYIANMPKSMRRKGWWRIECPLNKIEKKCKETGLLEHVDSRNNMPVRLRCLRRPYIKNNNNFCYNKPKYDNFNSLNFASRYMVIR